VNRAALARLWITRGKRPVDLLLSTSLVILTSPLLAACALAVLLADGPPVLFRQERVGRGGHGFRILKLRTMRSAPGPEVTAAGDPRVTAIGRRLRRAKLDELPQLANVVRGEMSLVGPRPEVPRYVRAHPREFRALERLRPGMVDWASLVFHDEEVLLAAHEGEPDFYSRVLLPRKLALARLYARRASPLLDLRLLLATGVLPLSAGWLSRQLIGASFYARARRL
jgi:lipopolysaccharide/colanic/teichoic acid biosynthesis glycosyltransferase